MLLRKTVIFILTIITLNMLLINSLADEDKFKDKKTVYLPIMMYHEVKPFKPGKDVITPWEFESDLKYLSKNNYTTIDMRELESYVYNNTLLPENPIILSFDDGYLNNYHYVLPLLKKYDMKIVFSIIGKNTDDFTRIPDNNLDYSHVTWEQLNEMLGTGCVEVQNHTYDLHKYTKSRVGCKQKYNESDEAYEKTLIEDIGKLQEEIAQMTGFRPNTFAYPYGASSKNTDAVLKKLGFIATLTCNYGINKITRCPSCLYGLKRICREHNSGIGSLLKEAYKTVH